MPSLPHDILNNLAVTLLGVTATFFVFAVTLLGNAVERAKTEESKTREKQRRDFETRITDLGNKIAAARKSGDLGGLKAELRKAEDSRRKSEQQIKCIQERFSLITAQKAVLFPSACFILAVTLNEMAREWPIRAEIVRFFMASVGLLAVGIVRLWRCLVLVQEVSVASESEQAKRLTSAFRAAMESIEKEKEEELYINFQNSFPIQVSRGSDIELRFRVGLKKGKFARNAEAWFHIPDEFTLVSPDTFWRQAGDFVVPNIRTVRINVGNVDVGLHTPRTLKLKAPTQEGKYVLMYLVKADGYVSQRENIDVVVQ